MSVTRLGANSLRAAGASAAGTSRVAARSALVCQRPRVVRCAVASTTGTSSDDVNFEELAEIIKLVDSTDIIEMEWKGKKFNLTIRKQEALQAAEPIYQTMAQAPAAYQLPPPPAPAAPAAPAPAAPAAAPVPPPAAPKPASPPVTGGIEIQSPMSGTFYSSAAPGEPAFVKVGDRVKKGQTVGIIEAMKLMNEIEAEASGEVIKLMAENGKPITAGQPIMVLRA